jgi:hypothetical protein
MAASVILWRVSSMRWTLRFISYFRGIEEIITHICALNLDSRFVLWHLYMHTTV